MGVYSTRDIDEQQNAWLARCCGDLIRSTYRHDFRSCRCTKCFCDGGNDYTRLGSDDPANLAPVKRVQLAVEKGTTHENGRGEVTADLVGKAWAKDGLFLGRFVLRHFEGDDAPEKAARARDDW